MVRLFVFGFLKIRNDLLCTERESVVDTQKIHENLAARMWFRTATTSGPAHKPARGSDAETCWERQAGCSARRAGSTIANERLRHSVDDAVVRLFWEEELSAAEVFKCFLPGVPSRSFLLGNL